MTIPDAREQPPETLEGWYALHQVYRVDRRALRGRPGAERTGAAESFVAAVEELRAPGDGWTILVDLVSAAADVMLMHFRPTLEALGDAKRRIACSPMADLFVPVYSFLSVTEAGMYQLTAQLAKRARTRGGSIGDEIYVRELRERMAAELASPHVQKRLYPEVPEEMPYVCFYPMNKRRAPTQNWYTLALEERSRLMMAHGMTGRRYAGKVQQIVTGAVGFDDWEWGVTLFARDPLEFKKLVSDMRFDEVSAKYAEFGQFYVGKRVDARAWVEGLTG